LLTYHDNSLEEAGNKANTVFASALKEKLAIGGKSESIYPSSPELDAWAAIPLPVRRHGRVRKVDKEASLAKQCEVKRRGRIWPILPLKENYPCGVCGR